MSSHHVLTLLARSWQPASAERLLHVVAGEGLRLSPAPAETLAGTELTLQRVEASGELSTEAHKRLRQAAEDAALDLFIEPKALFHTPRRLFAFDMDSTLIQAEVIDELAALAGKKAEVAAVTERAMRGEIDFRTSLTHRVSLLKGIEAAEIAVLKERIQLGEGLERLMTGLKAAGIRTAILSGGFGFFGRHLQQKLGFDYVTANELEIADGQLTGGLAAEIVDGHRKASRLSEIADELQLSMSEVVAAGDGANDLPMLATAATGVAYRAKPIVRASAAYRLNFCGLDALLHLVGRG